MALKYLMERKRRLANKTEKLVSLDYIKDAVITQMQPMFGTDIIDVTFGDVDKNGEMNVTIYTKKGKSK